MATVSKEQEQAIKKYLRNSKNFIEYDGVKIIDQTEFGRFIAKLFNLPDDVSDKPGMNKVGYLKKQNAELFDGYEIRKGNIFKRDKPLIQALNNDPVFKDEVNKKLKALNKKDFFDLTKDQQNTIVGTTEKVKKDLKVLPKNFFTKPQLAKELKISEAAIEAYGLGKHELIGEKFRELFKPVVLKNRGTFYDSTNINKKIEKFKNFTDRPMLHKTSVARANLLASDPEIQNLLEAKDKSLFNTDEGLKKALKVLGKGSTPHEAAHAITVLARAYNGEKFRGLDIKPNKTKGKFIINNIAKLQYDNPWTTGLYDEGLRQVDRDLGNKVNTFKNFKVAYRDKLQNLLKEYGIKEKFNINEITSVKASANNKIAPYAAFVDLTQADINQKALSGFQGDLSKTLSYIDRNKNNQAKILEKIEKFNTGTRKKRIDSLVKEFGEGAKDVRFAEIIPGTNVESIYAKGDLDRWKTKGLDLQKLADEKGYFLDVKGARPYFEVTSDDLKKSVEGLVNKAEGLSEPDKIKVCNFLSNGGLPGDCARAIRQDPNKAAQIISKIPADTEKLQEVKVAAQEVIGPKIDETNLKWNNDIGAIVETNNPDFAVKNVTEDLKLYADENPIPVDIDTKPPKTSPTVLKTIGKTLTKVGAPLPTALIDSYFVGQQVKDGKSTAEIAQDPMNWIGLAAMEPLSKVSGIAESGKLNSALRLGLNPATIRGISRFAGLPGLAVSTAMTAYDQYKKYQNEEGFIYNLFNKEEK
ncbi:hypothetical protein [phage 023Pt_psg01]|nr:hypothetical protein [phage 023Pt_psg01]